MNFLEDILLSRRQDLEQQKAVFSLHDLRERVQRLPPSSARFKTAFIEKDLGLIAEIKRASPSRGMLRSELVPKEVARQYQAAGAKAISVLTETRYFRGSGQDLIEVRAAADLPILRKDFIIDAYQVYEARLWGADALLLLTGCLDPRGLMSLCNLSREVGLEPVVEVHTEEELKIALDLPADFIGINNRDLKTFAVDLRTTQRLLPKIPAGKRVISESGISNRRDVDYLRGLGIRIILVGEALLTKGDIGSAVRELVGYATPKTSPAF
jgi:indole-3-glycerol phosphate synthase